MASKLTLDAILYRIFKETQKWEMEGGIPNSIPPIIRKQPIFHHNVWKNSTEFTLEYDEFLFFVKEHLKLTSQTRIVKERWTEMKKFGYLKEVNTSGAFKLQLNLVRPLFGEPNPSEKREDKIVSHTEDGVKV